jgi:hypothetical protein
VGLGGPGEEVGEGEVLAEGDGSLVQEAGQAGGIGGIERDGDHALNICSGFERSRPPGLRPQKRRTFVVKNGVRGIAG